MDKLSDWGIIGLGTIGSNLIMNFSRNGFKLSIYNRHLKGLEENIAKGFILLSAYSLGLAIPFVISGILLDKFVLFSKNLRKYMSIITKVGGLILLLTGIAILTNQLQVLGFFMLEYFPSFGRIG